MEKNKYELQTLNQKLNLEQEIYIILSKNYIYAISDH